jgi:hypothetical protein
MRPYNWAAVLPSTRSRCSWRFSSATQSRPSPIVQIGATGQLISPDVEHQVGLSSVRWDRVGSALSLRTGGAHGRCVMI